MRSRGAPANGCWWRVSKAFCAAPGDAKVMYQPARSAKVYRCGRKAEVSFGSCGTWRTYGTHPIHVVGSEVRLEVITLERRRLALAVHTLLVKLRPRDGEVGHAIAGELLDQDGPARLPRNSIGRRATPAQPAKGFDPPIGVEEELVAQIGLGAVRRGSNNSLVGSDGALLVRVELHVLLAVAVELGLLLREALLGGEDGVGNGLRHTRSGAALVRSMRRWACGGWVWGRSVGERLRAVGCAGGLADGQLRRRKAVRRRRAVAHDFRSGRERGSGVAGTSRSRR